MPTFAAGETGAAMLRFSLRGAFPSTTWYLGAHLEPPHARVAEMHGNAIRFSERELISPGPPETSRLSRPPVDASASDGQPLAARPEG